jgi:hypothetical protein
LHGCSSSEQYREYWEDSCHENGDELDGPPQHPHFFYRTSSTQGLIPYSATEHPIMVTIPHTDMADRKDESDTDPAGTMKNESGLVG